MIYKKPIPVKDPDNYQYWEAARRHELELQKCGNCNEYIHPAGPGCPNCGGSESSWFNLGNQISGTVYSYVVPYRAFMPGFAEEVPYVVVLVVLDNAPKVKITANLLNCAPENVTIGMPVRMVWEDITEEATLPQWVPA